MGLNGRNHCHTVVLNTILVSRGLNYDLSIFHDEGENTPEEKKCEYYF